MLPLIDIIREMVDEEDAGTIDFSMNPPVDSQQVITIGACPVTDMVQVHHVPCPIHRSPMTSQHPGLSIRCHALGQTNAPSQSAQ